MKFKRFVITKDGPRMLGETGRTPYGRLNADDEGELTMAIAADPSQGVVRIDFGKPIAWLGLPSAQCRELAALLNKNADDLDRAKA